MTYKVTEKVSTNKLPEPGDLWKHPQENEVYMRIFNDHGARALGTNNAYNYMFSVSMTNGAIRKTVLSEDPCSRIVRLEPEGGRMILVEK